jgi:hypothetical protein
MSNDSGFGSSVLGAGAGGRSAPRQNLGQGFHGDAGRERGGGGGQRFAVIVDLRVVVEDDHPVGRMPGAREFDGLVDIVDAGGDDPRLGLGQNRGQCRRGGTGLQGNRYRTQLAERRVDHGVIGAGEPEDGDPVTCGEAGGMQGRGGRADAVPQLGVGDGVEARE